MWYIRDVLYAVSYVRVSCFVVRGCGVSRRYIDTCYCDMFSVVNVYLDHLKLCVVCINSLITLIRDNITLTTTYIPSTCFSSAQVSHHCHRRRHIASLRINSACIDW